MADQANRPPESPEPAAGKPAEPAPTPHAFWHRLISRLATRQLLAALLAISLVGHGIGYGYYRLTVTHARGPASPEISLGQYRFESTLNQGDPVHRAAFTLHVALISPLDRVARQRLVANKYRVRQGIEELLRGARGGDFEDPSLGGLKRRLQEQINRAIALRAVAEVIVTDLRLDRDSDSGPNGDGSPGAAVGG